MSGHLLELVEQKHGPADVEQLTAKRWRAYRLDEDKTTIASGATCTKALRAALAIPGRRS